MRGSESEPGSTTVELFWVFSRDDFPVRETALRPLFDLLASVPDVTWTRYDQNGMGLWKEFEPGRATVDALTQRTAMLRIEGEDGAMALLALGKRGEPPTLIIRQTTARFEPLGSWWQETFTASLPSVERAGITPVAARDAYRKSRHGLASVGGVDITCWWTAASGSAGELLSRLDIETSRQGDMTVARLLSSPAVDPSDAADVWKRIGEALSG